MQGKRARAGEVQAVPTLVRAGGWLQAGLQAQENPVVTPCSSMGKGHSRPPDFIILVFNEDCGKLAARGKG